MRKQYDWRSATAKALQALNIGAVVEAREIGQALLQEAPDDPAGQQLMAAIELKAGNYSEAERWALSSLAARPDHVATLVLAGQVARARGDLAQGVLRFQQAAMLDPGRPDAAFFACMALIEKGGHDIQPIVGDLIARFPDYAPGWTEIGDLLGRAGQREAAAVAYARAARAAPLAALHLRRGSALQAIGRLDEAAEALKQALALDPTLVAAWFKLGLVLQDCRDAVGATVAYRQALALRADLGGGGGQSRRRPAGAGRS